MIAQLRDVLAAENSSIVAEKNNNRGLSLPKRAQANFRFVGIGQDDGRELLAKRCFHDETSLKDSWVVSRIRSRVVLECIRRIARLQMHRVQAEYVL